ncbi:MAG: hypothetical protein ABEH38_02680 [Flavobacteriales bacterium]
MAYPSIYHIGFPKTGSTSLQALLKEDPRIQMLYKPGYFISDRYYTHSYPALDPDKPAIQSNEAIMRQYFKGWGSGYQTVLERIREKRPDARIVLFLREQSEILLSEYKFHILTGYDHYKMGTYLNTPAGKFFREIIAYDRILRELLSIFPREQVHVYLNEEMKADATAFLERFSRELFGMPPPNIPLKQENKGIPASEVRMKRAINRVKIFRNRPLIDRLDGVLIDGFFKALRPFASKEGKGKAFLKECPYFERIMEEYAKSNARTLELMELPLAEHGYRVSHGEKAPG